MNVVKTCPKLLLTARFCVCSAALLAVICSTASAQGNDEVAERPDSVKQEPAIDVPPQLLKLFDEGQYPPDASGDDPKVEYRLLKPPHYDRSKKYPLILWLHGYGMAEIVNRNFGQLQNFKTTVGPTIEKQDRRGFFMLVPQRPEKIGSWQQTLTSENEDNKKSFVAADGVFGIIEQLKKDYNIDENRVSVVGISAGGSEGWTMVKQRPDLFSAFAPIAVKSATIQDLDKLKGISVWAFYSSGDRPGNGKEVIAQLNQVGGWGYYTEIKSFEHNCWGGAFQDHNLLNWLLDQEKGVYKRKPFQWTDYKYVLSYWPHVVVGGVIVICYLAVRREQKKKAPGIDVKVVG